MKYANRVNIESNDTHSVILSKIKSDSHIVEFGTSRGYMTNYLVNALNCEVIGFEIDEEAAKVAADFASEMYVCDINNTEFWMSKLLGREFDYIIFADVLEHIDNPDMILEISKGFLKDEGKIIVSIPNNTHNSILIDIFNDELSARSNGLLDNTHKHFMNQIKMERFIESSGLYIEEMVKVTMPPYKTELFNDYSMIPDEVANYAKQRLNGEVYQFVFILTSKSSTESRISNIEVGDYLEIFWKGSTDFSAENSVRRSVSWGKSNSLNINIQSDEVIEFLRFDPSSFRGIMKINGFKINGLKYSISDKECNNLILNSGLIITLNSDSQILFKLSDKVKNIDIDIEIDYMKRLKDLNELIALISEDNKSLENLKAKISAHDKLNEYSKSIEELNCELAKKDKWIEKLGSDILSKDEWIKKIESDVLSKDEWIKKIESDTLSKDKWIEKLNYDIKEKDAWIDKLSSDFEKLRVELSTLMIEKDKWIEKLNRDIDEQVKWINKLESDMKEKDSWIIKLQKNIDELKKV